MNDVNTELPVELVNSQDTLTTFIFCDDDARYSCCENVEINVTDDMDWMDWLEYVDNHWVTVDVYPKIEMCMLRHFFKPTVVKLRDDRNVLLDGMKRIDLEDLATGTHKFKRMCIDMFVNDECGGGLDIDYSKINNKADLLKIVEEDINESSWWGFVPENPIVYVEEY